MFYELIREWEEKRLTTGWSVQEVLGNKIKFLVNVNTDLANHLHFARLFLSQLISMCKGDGVIRTEDDDDNNIALLAHLKKTNPAKFKKLQERFIQPFSVGGPCPPVSFPGNQEFFKEFIVAASSPVLNQHLSNIFTAKIKKLNSTEFSQNPSEENQDSQGVNQDQYELFSSCLLTLRLLGKFLGFLTFTPYHSVHGLPDNIQSNYIELRNNQPNPIDIQELIVFSINTGRLNITIPWIIEYLSMMDRIAPVLNYYHRVLHILQYIHRLSWNTLKKEKYNYGCLMLVSMLGWLFESPIMPQGIFRMEVTDELPYIKAIDTCSTNCSLKPVDNVDLVNQELLYTVCPYLGEIRTLLLEFAVGANSKSTIRKITPVSADDLPEPETDRNLQTQLEENFFHNHPASMKRTVDFVSERTASNFIKHFRATDLPWSISEAKSKVISLLQSLNSSVVSPSNKLKDQNLQLEYKKIAQNLCEEVKRKVSNTKREYCSSRVNSALKLLLPDEQSPAVTNMAASICCRLAEDRIKSWMTNHISTAMYLKEVNTEADKVFKKLKLEQSSSRQIDLGNRLDLPVALLNSTPEASNSLTNLTTKSVLSQAVLIPVSSVEDGHYKHREDVISLSDLLHTIQMINKEILVNRCSSLDYTRLMMIMEQTHQILLFKEDTVPQAVRSLAQLILDLAISIISYMPEFVTVELLDCYKRLYLTELKDVTIFSIVSSPRWFYLLHTSQNKQKCVASYVLFICLLLIENLITTDVYEKGCIKVLNSSSIIRDENVYVVNNGRILQDNEDLYPDQVYHVIPRLVGGKGGFGSMLRAIGAQIEKTTSREACRDLGGRRMRDVNNEKKLKEWLGKQSEREREKEEKRKERLERRRNKPQHKFDDPTFFEEKNKVVEDLEDALQKGLEKSKGASATVTSETASGSGECRKRKATSNGSTVKIKKNKGWLGIDPDLDLSDLDTSDEDEDKTGSSSDNNSYESDKASNTEQDTELKLNGDKLPSEDTDRIPTEEKDKSPSKPEQSSLLEILPPPVSESQPNLDNEPIDLDEYNSVEELEALGLNRLKNSLMERGLKCGGTLQQRAERLFSVKGLKQEEIDPSLFAKPTKKKGK